MANRAAQQEIYEIEVDLEVSRPNELMRLKQDLSSKYFSYISISSKRTYLKLATGYILFFSCSNELSWSTKNTNWEVITSTTGRNSTRQRRNVILEDFHAQSCVIVPNSLKQNYDF